MSQRIIITGAAVPTGHALCTALLATGAYLHCIDTVPLSYQHERLHSVVDSLTDYHSVQAQFRDADARMGGIDVLITIAAQSQRHAPRVATSPEQRHAQIAAAVGSVATCCDAILPVLRQRPGPKRIVDIWLAHHTNPYTAPGGTHPHDEAHIRMHTTQLADAAAAAGDIFVAAILAQPCNALEKGAAQDLLPMWAQFVATGHQSLGTGTVIQLGTRHISCP